MKKILLVLITAVTCLLLVGCTPKKDNSVPKDIVEPTVAQPTKSDDEIKDAFKGKVNNFSLSTNSLNSAIDSVVRTTTQSLPVDEITKIQVPNITFAVDTKLKDDKVVNQGTAYIFQEGTKIYVAESGPEKYNGFYIDLAEVKALASTYVGSLPENFDYVSAIAAQISGSEVPTQLIDSMLALVKFKDTQFKYSGKGVFTFDKDALAQMLQGFGLGDAEAATKALEFVEKFELTLGFDGNNFTNVKLNVKTKITEQFPLALDLNLEVILGYAAKENVQVLNGISVKLDAKFSAKDGNGNIDCKLIITEKGIYSKLSGVVNQVVDGKEIEMVNVSEEVKITEKLIEVKSNGHQAVEDKQVISSYELKLDLDADKLTLKATAEGSYVEELIGKGSLELELSSSNVKASAKFDSVEAVNISSTAKDGKVNSVVVRIIPSAIKAPILGDSGEIKEIIATITIGSAIPQEALAAKAEAVNVMSFLPIAK